MSNAAQVADPLLGVVIGQRFLIKERLDNTGRAAVYRGQHVLMQSNVALKVAESRLGPGDEALARFQRVARVATQIDHESCATINDFGLDDRGYVYLAMELCPGHDLERILASDGPMTAEVVCAMGRQILEGLDAAHRRGILHRELQPKYVMVDLGGGSPTVKLLGFGLAAAMRHIEAGATDNKLDPGVARYAAPEMIQHKSHNVDHRADLFSVGAILYEAITGVTPWPEHDNDPAGRIAITPGRPSRLRTDGEVSMALDRFFMRALDPAPSQRYQSASEMIEFLERAVLGGGQEVSTVAAVQMAFGRYKLLRKVAAGGMGELHLAKSETLPGLSKVCALKMLRPELISEKAYVDRFLEEAKLVCQLSHANMATVYEVGKVDDTFYMAMEYVVGRDCRRILDRSREDALPIPIPVALFIAREVAAALSYAHRVRFDDDDAEGLIHRDVSPTNIVVAYEGAVKLIDFGLAKHATSVGRTESGIVLGKLAYLAPEQCLGEPVDHRADIFSVGAVLYELLSGQRIRDPDSMQELAEAVEKPVQVLPSAFRGDIPIPVDRIVERALAVAPDKRYQSAGALRDDLSQILARIAPRVSADEVGSFVKSLFVAEARADTRLARGLLTRRPLATGEDSALGGDSPRSAVGEENTAVAAPIPQEFLDARANSMIDGPTEVAPVPLRVPLPVQSPRSDTVAMPAAELSAADTLSDDNSPPVTNVAREVPKASSRKSKESTAVIELPAPTKVVRRGPSWVFTVLVALILGGIGAAVGWVMWGQPDRSPAPRRPHRGGAALPSPNGKVPSPPVAAMQPDQTPAEPSPELIAKAVRKRVAVASLTAAKRVLGDAGVTMPELIALPTIAEALKSVKGELAKGEIGASLSGLDRLQSVLRIRRNRCDAIQKRKHRWCSRMLKRIRKRFPKPRKKRRAAEVKWGFGKLRAKLKAARNASRKKKASCRERGAAYAQLIPKLANTLAALEGGGGPKPGGKAEPGARDKDDKATNDKRKKRRRKGRKKAKPEDDLKTPELKTPEKKPEKKPEAKPESKPEPKPESKPESKPDPKPTKPEPKPDQPSDSD